MKLTKREKNIFGWFAYGLFLVCCCEIVLRVYLVHFADPVRFRTYASRTMLERRFKQPKSIPHFYLGYQNNPKYSNEHDLHNSYGFRGEEIQKHKEAGVFRIVCIGGSTTYSSDVDDYRQSYPYLLERELTSNGFQAQVINAGVIGYSSLQSYLNYQMKIEELTPDMLIVYHAFNDVWTRMVWPAEAYRADQSGLVNVTHPVNDNLIRKLSVLRIPLVRAGIIYPVGSWNEIEGIEETNYGVEFTRQLIHENYPSGFFETVPIDSMIRTNRPSFFHRNLSKLIRHAHSKGTEVVLTSVIYSDEEPKAIHVLKNKAFQRAISEHNGVTRKLAIEHEVNLLDLEKTLVPKKEWFTDGMHFNYEGNQKRAEHIAEFLAPIIQKTLANRNERTDVSTGIE